MLDDSLNSDQNINRIEMQKGQQHPKDFPGGHPPQYYPGLARLNFGVQMGSGAFNAVWPLTKFLTIMAVILEQNSVKMYCSHIDDLQSQVGQKESQERFRSSEPMVYLEPRLATVTILVPNSLRRKHFMNGISCLTLV